MEAPGGQKNKEQEIFIEGKIKLQHATQYLVDSPKNISTIKGSQLIAQLL